MTLADLEIKRDSILASVGFARSQFGDRSLEYSKQQDALALIDAEISRVKSAAGTDRPHVSYIEHDRG